MPKSSIESHTVKTLKKHPNRKVVAWLIRTMLL
jgi:hypothetical protein